MKDKEMMDRNNDNDVHGDVYDDDVYDGDVYDDVYVDAVYFHILYVLYDVSFYMNDNHIFYCMNMFYHKIFRSFMLIYISVPK